MSAITETAAEVWACGGMNRSSYTYGLHSVQKSDQSLEGLGVRKEGASKAGAASGTASVVLPDRRHRCLLLVSGNEVIIAHFMLLLGESVPAVAISQPARKEE